MGVWRQYTPELLTDLYELTMAESYLREGMSGEATFSLYIRDYPPNRAYFVLAGIEHLLEIISNLRFNEASIRYLASTGLFSSSLLEYLEGFRFTGTVRAMREGRLFFAYEPAVEITAPIIEAQILETLVINVVQLESMIASKAARCVHAAQGRGLIDFSLRRTQGVDAGVKVARASYIAGFMGSSNLLAGKIYGIPVFGTMAHSYVSSFPNEMDAFAAFSEAYPGNAVLLIDTYDTLSGAAKAVEIARRMAAKGERLSGVRLDSGDLVRLSREVRDIFRKAGLDHVKILASGNLDEFRLQELLQSGAEIDVFAVGTRMGVSADAPYCDIAYKLVEYDGRPVLKMSTGKKTWVGKKQVFRLYDDQGMMRGDVLGLQSESHPGAEPLLELAVEGGMPVRALESLETIRERFAGERRRLPGEYHELVPSVRYPVGISAGLEALDEQVARETWAKEIGRV
jgi:nicotinate phosphoribosyltransferase